MRRLGGILLVLACAGALGASGAGVGVAGAKTKHAPARLLVYAQEWSLWPSRTTLPAGTVIVQLWNRGQDAHDLRIRRLSHGAMVGRVLGRVKVTVSGGLSQATWHLRKGRYMIYCSMPGHFAMGMHTRLTVVR
jgi:plastocyanin